MKTPPQSTWDRDPEGTYRKMIALIDEDVANGYLVGSEITRMHRAAARCFLRAKRCAR